MRTILITDESYAYLDGTAAKLLVDARAARRDLGLATIADLGVGAGRAAVPLGRHP